MDVAKQYRILYHHRIASKDGQYVHVEEIINSLRKAGHQVFVVAPKLTEQSEFGSSGGMVAWLKQRLPHQRARHAEVVGQFLLGQLGARLQAVLDDGAGQARHDEAGGRVIHALHDSRKRRFVYTFGGLFKVKRAQSPGVLLANRPTKKSTNARTRAAAWWRWG